MIVDTHLHVASTDEARYPRSSARLPTSAWWEHPGRDAESLVFELGRAGVAVGLLVQAVGLYGFDNAYLLDAVAAHGDSVAAVPAVDLGLEDGPAEIEALAGRPGVVGVRLFAIAGARPWVGTPAAGAALEALGGAGAVGVLTATGEQLEALLPALAGCGASVALDHCAFPRLSERGIVEGDPVLALAPLGHVHLKVSSHLFGEATDAGCLPERLVEQLVAAFGAERIMWGSDHPQTELPSYGAHLDLARTALAGLDRKDQEAVLGANAARLFGLAV